MEQAHAYLVELGDVYFAIDTTWPDGFKDYKQELSRQHIEPTQIKYLMVTHFHLDHAGLVEKIKEFGTKFIVLDYQVPFLSQMEEIIKRQPKYRYYQPLNLETSTVTLEQANAFFLEKHLPLKVEKTKGHSEDSLSLVFQDGSAFVGDLYPRDWVLESDVKNRESWKILKKLGARKVYHAHGEEEYEVID